MHEFSFFFTFPDINECLTDGICGYNAQCINEEGSYRCQCPENYVFNAELNFCEGTVIVFFFWRGYKIIFVSICIILN